MASDRTGLLIIRVWIEEGSSEPLRAHIRISDDVAGGFQRTVTLCRPEAVGAEVQEWLTQVLAGETLAEWAGCVRKRAMDGRDEEPQARLGAS